MLHSQIVNKLPLIDRLDVMNLNPLFRNKIINVLENINYIFDAYTYMLLRLLEANKNIMKSWVVHLNL